VLVALRAECPDLRVSASPEVHGAEEVVSRFLPELINGLIAVGDAALVLDDFHRLGAGLARDSVAWFVDHAPSTFQVVLATRSEPALALGAMRAYGELVEIRAADLEFTAEEAGVLLNDRFDLGLEPQSVNDLVERTEGWPAGLYLAALSLGRVGDRHAFVGEFGGSNRHVASYLVDEVLDAHDAPMRALMLRTSILERICGSLCDAVLEEEGSAERLRELARTNLFLVPLDDHGEWFRFHHLFAKLLRVELEHREPGTAAALHQRAFAWHREHGSVDEAVDQALEARLFVEAAELIATVWPQYADVCRYATVLRWLARFPPEWSGTDPRLQLVAIWMRSLSGEREAARDALQVLEQFGPLERGPLPDGFSSPEASLVTLRAVNSWGDFHEGLAHARRAADLEQPGSRWWPSICAAVGALLYMRDDLNEGDRWLEEAADSALRQQRWSVACQALSVRSVIAGDQGRAADQSLLAQQADALAQARGLKNVLGEPEYAIGASLTALGQPAEALQRLDACLDLLRSRGHPMPLVLTLIQRAGALQALHQEQPAADAVAEAMAIVDECSGAVMFRARLAALARPAARPTSKNGAISDRELVILRMLAGSLSERDMGRELYLSHNTIHSHTRSIYRKLGVSSRSEAVKQARELGII
jgi:LuxR family maltose regulon positive regulatory protein